MIVRAPSDWERVPGIFCGNGKCIDGSSLGAGIAHAHLNARDEDFPGWICFSRRKDIGRISNHRVVAPSQALFHEYAHILSQRGHDDRWRAKMLNLGQQIPLSYERKSTREFDFSEEMSQEKLEIFRKYLLQHDEAHILVIGYIAYAGRAEMVSKSSKSITEQQADALITLFRESKVKLLIAPHREC